MAFLIRRPAAYVLAHGQLSCTKQANLLEWTNCIGASKITGPKFSTLLRNTLLTKNISFGKQDPYRATAIRKICNILNNSKNTKNSYLINGKWHQNAVIIRRLSQRASTRKQNQTTVLYICASGIFMLGLGYAGVPLYRMFCQSQGLGGNAATNAPGHDTSKIESMQPVKDRVIRVKFNADIASSMQWNFRPQQTEVKLIPGETALAFYTAKNPTDKPVIGISTYNVIPFEAGQYFNKIQCFCFEEQRLNPHEQVDMPVFFYIDPEFAEDPKLEFVDSITLSYTFFEAKEGMEIPLPGFMQPIPQS